MRHCHLTTLRTDTRQDTNREVVTIDLQKLIAWLPSEQLTTIVLIVLFNLCNDFGTVCSIL